MLAKVVHPAFTLVARRSLVAADLTKQYLTGRWVCCNAAKQFDFPGSRSGDAGYGLYFLLEGTHNHIGGTTDFDGSGAANVGFKSQKAVQLPSNQVQGALTGASGVFVGMVGPEGVDPTAITIANDPTTPANGRLTVDAYGRFIKATGSNVVVAVAEVVVTDGSNITSLVFRTTGN